MKKYGFTILVTLALIVLAVLYFNLNKNFEASKDQVESLTVQLEEKNKDNEALIENASSLVDALKESEDELEGLQEQLLSKEETLGLIDERLKAEGKIVEKIDDLLSENSQWKEELDAMALKLSALEEEGSKELEPVVVQTPSDDMSWKQWVSELQTLVNFVDKRIVELEAAVSMLSPISLERIMIQQEIDFLETTQSDLMALQNEITTEKQ